MSDRRPSYAAIGISLALIAGWSCSDDSETDPISSVGPGGSGGSDGGSGGSGGSTSTTSSSSGTDLPARFTIEGVVVDGDGTPVAGATVLQGGRSYDPPHELSDSDGTFTLDIIYDGRGDPAVVASKEDYRTGGAELFSVPVTPVEVVIYEVVAPDNEGYTYLPPGVGSDPSTAWCGHCHETLTAEFQTSKHAQATRDPLVQDLYAGVTQAFNTANSCTAAGGSWKQGLVPGSAADPVSKCYLGGGVLPDLNSGCGDANESACDDPALPMQMKPSAFGACADCHAPAIDGAAGGRNLHEAVGISYDNGVHCDLCHKVKDIDLSKPPGVAGRLVLQRPRESLNSPTGDFRAVMYGPLLDVPNGFMGGNYQPKFDQAVFCAGCHEQKQAALIAGDSLDAQRWPDGLPVHSTYSEWLVSPYAGSATPCQHCHMPPAFDMVNSVNVTTLDNQSIVFGWQRPPSDNRQHIFRSPLRHGTPRLIDSAVFVSVSLIKGGGEIDANVSLSNVGAGHALPTGEPMRSLVLLLDAQGGGCNLPLPPSGGMTVHDVGGALAQGVEGQDVTTAGATMTWAAGAQLATAGMVVRVVRPSGAFDDYNGVGFFADPNLTPAEKGLEVFEPVGQATVQSAGSGQLQLDQALTLQAGDVIYLGDARVGAPVDAQVSLRLAGAAGYTFSKILSDSTGARGVPHYRAVDIASDNRIPPSASALTNHSFTALNGCTSATITATLLYRPLPTEMATLRGWDAKDYVIATAQQTITLP